MKSSSSAVNRGRGVWVKRFSNVFNCVLSDPTGGKDMSGSRGDGRDVCSPTCHYSWKIGRTCFNYVGPDGPAKESGRKLLESV